MYPEDTVALIKQLFIRINQISISRKSIAIVDILTPGAAKGLVAWTPDSKS